MESSIRTVRAFSDFFLVCKLYDSALQVIPLISDHLTLRFMGSVDIGGFSSGILRRGQFQFLVNF